jgi:diguanylate cyclase (GGDEF)-like protein
LSAGSQAGTCGGGINILEPGADAAPRLRHLTTAQGLPDDNTLLEGAQGRARANTDDVSLLADVDHVKRVNDHHGHGAGEEVLVQFGARLRVPMRETDDRVHWGGEGFLAAARNADRARAAALAERIRQAIAGAPFVLADERRLVVTCSTGFAYMPFARPPRPGPLTHLGGRCAMFVRLGVS